MKGKNLCFSITKPFDKMLKTPEIDKWCEILCNYRTENYDEFKQLTKKIELFEDIYKQNTSELLVII